MTTIARLVGRVGVEVLVGAVGRDVDEIALAPFEALRLLVPRPLELVLAVEAHVPVQVVAAALDDVEDLFGQVAVLAAAPCPAGGTACRCRCSTPWCPCFSLMMCLISPSGERSNGIWCAFDDVQAAFVFAAELLRGLQRLGVEIDVAGLRVGALGARVRRRSRLIGLSPTELGRAAYSSPGPATGSFGGYSHHLLEDHVHEQEQRLRLHDQARCIRRRDRR